MSAIMLSQLSMNYEYIEVAGGDHVSIAAQNLPKIFEYFDKHKHGEKNKGK
jgi:hypothetical protein